jgi:hypothetical protein
MLIPFAVLTREGEVDATKPALVPRYQVHPVPRVSVAPPVESCFRINVKLAPLASPVTFSVRDEVE